MTGPASMKRGSLLAIGGIVLAAVLALGAAVSDQVQVGRFQIVTVPVPSAAGIDATIILLDTTTGDARVLDKPAAQPPVWGMLIKAP